jgi:transposase InsO family protein
MQIKRLFYGVRGSFNLYEDAVRWAYMLTEKAKHKAKVLVFWEKHGLQATIDAYSVKRSTLFLWKKQLKDNNGVVESLNEKSKVPKRKRQRTVDSQTESFILNIRKEHPRIGKDKIKALLDQQESLEHISISTIGRVISDLKKKGLISTNKKLSFYARTGNLFERSAVKRKKTRRKGYKPIQPGDLLQIDTIVLFINGIKRYIVSAIDLTSDFAFAYAYTSASSNNVKDFFFNLEQVVPFSIKRIQTDNGSEFEHFFREYIEKKNIIHFHNYPKCPKMNAVIERFNRTIQEEFISWHKETLAWDLFSFNHKLINWLLWYNTQRPHHSLKQIPPLKFIINNSFLASEKSNMLWTHTGA